MRGFWDHIAGLYDLSQAFNPRANQAMVQAVTQWVSPGCRVLDCGAGTGALSLAAAKKARFVLCTDLSPAMLARAREKARREGVENIAFAERNLFSHPTARPYDAVIAGNILHLLDQPADGVRALAACLHPGGRLILPTYLQGEAAAWFKTALAAYQLAGFRPRQRYTRDSYLEMLAGCGVGSIAYYQTLPGALPVGFAVLTITKQEAVS